MTAPVAGFALRWVRIGPDSSITMARRRPWVGGSIAADRARGRGATRDITRGSLDAKRDDGSEAEYRKPVEPAGSADRESMAFPRCPRAAQRGACQGVERDLRQVECREPGWIAGLYGNINLLFLVDFKGPHSIVCPQLRRGP
jgi:hypothetical protein